MDYQLLAPFEGPEDVSSLIATPEQNTAITNAIRATYGDVEDPDLYAAGILNLARVKGQFRTSIVIDSADGMVPYSDAGLELVNWTQHRFTSEFDHPEQRPLTERCLDGWGSAPMRVLPILILRQIVQTRDYLVIQHEDSAGLRIVRIGDKVPAATPRTIEGYSLARWEGDTLVLQTSHLLAADPMRENFGRTVVISPATQIEERFQRISATELLYRYTVTDPELYTQPWSGEFSLELHDGAIYEYACHEGNYSMPSILLGGRAEVEKQAQKQLTN